MNDRPLVSVITPVFNSARFIRDTLDSVLNQTYENWEMIMVDDCSTDESVAIISEYLQRDTRLRLIELENNGGSGPARNEAINVASGRIIAFLDSDDTWASEKLEKHVPFMISQKAVLSHTSFGYLDEEGKKIKSTFHVSKNPITYKDLLKRTEIGCLTAMYDTHYLGKMYMPDLRRKQDYALWLKILKMGHYSIPLDLELSFYRQVNNSVTSKKWKLVFEHWQFLYKREKLNFFESTYYLICWAFSGIKKYYIK